MHSDVMGKGGGGGWRVMILSDMLKRTRITVLSECCYAMMHTDVRGRDG